MSQRGVRSLCRVVFMVCVAALVANAAAAQDVPRTSWGQPDLQGVWDFRTITPLQRPSELGEQEFLSEEEASARDQAASERNRRLWEKPAEPTVAGGNVDSRGAGEAPGSYNQFWIDSGTRTVDTRRTSLIVDPPDGRMPAFTAAGQQRADAIQSQRRDPVMDSFVNFDPNDRCILGFNAGPPITPGAYNNNMQVFQTEDHVVIMTEMVHTSRVIPLDGTPGLSHKVTQWSGDSRGHWEGDTLVIETKNFAGKRQWRGSGEAMVLTERLTRVDADTLLYAFTVDDPESWTAPWTAEVPMRRNELQMYEFACHEGNYSMPVMLGGRRAEELAGTGQP